MITDYKITEIFCAVDEFCKEFDKQIDKKSLLSSDGKSRRYRKASISDSEIMTILIVFQFGSFRNFKHYYLFFIRQHLKSDFPNAVSYNRFVELQSRVFFQMMFFLNLSAFGHCTGISFVDSTMVPVCHNLRRYANKVFKGLATDGKGTMGWCHGFKLHLVCNDRGEIITFCFTGANVDDRDPRVWAVLAKTLYGKLFADRGYISPKLFDMLFEDGVHLVTGIRTNMKNKLMPMWDKVMLRKRCIIETINDMLKNTAQLVHSRHRSVNNFIMSMIAALAAYCFFDNKPQALEGYCIDDVFGNLGLYRIAIDNLDECDALFVILYRGYFAEYFEFFGYNYTDEITRNVLFPRGIFLQSDDVCRHDDRRKRLISVDAHEIEVASHRKRNWNLVAGG